MTSSTGITLRACSALSRKQLFSTTHTAHHRLHTHTRHTHFGLTLSRRNLQILDQEPTTTTKQRPLLVREEDEEEKPVFLVELFFSFRFQTVAPQRLNPTVTVFAVRLRLWRENETRKCDSTPSVSPNSKPKENLQDGDT